LKDVEHIGEIAVTADHEFVGKRVSEASDKQDIEILLVLRGELSLFPTDNLVLQKNDIVVLKSGRITRRQTENNIRKKK
jgi:voltage-gated potassium channel